MSFLPVVERELLVASRRRGTFRARGLVAVITSGIAAVVIVLSGVSGARAGGGLFRFLMALAFIYCIVEAARTAADAFSEEKREGTLGLLFLTDLRGHDVVLGKLAAVSIRSFQGLFAFFPVLAVALIVGGVTVGEFWRAAVTLTNLLFVAVSVAGCVSVFSIRSHRALGASFILLLFLCIYPRASSWLSGMGLGAPAWLWAVSPAYPAVVLADVVYQRNPFSFWSSVVASHMLGWLLLGIAAMNITRAWQAQATGSMPGKTPGRGGQVGRGEDLAKRELWRNRMLATNPVLWLAARNQEARTLSWVFIAVCGGVVLAGWVMEWMLGGFGSEMAMVLLVILSFGLKIWIASHASWTLAEARWNGSIELLLATPLKADEIVTGQWLALQRFFLGPVIAVSVLQVGLLAVDVVEGTNPANSGSLPWFGSIGLALFGAATFVVDAVAVGWVGMWVGINSPKPAVAFVKTILIAVVLPVLAFCIPNLLIDFVLISWAQSGIRNRFRRAVAREPH